MAHRTSGLPSQRQLRLGELVRRLLADILARGDVYEPMLQTHVITIPEVRMSADLKVAHVYVVALGGGDGKDIVEACQRASKWLRGQVGRGLDAKFTPELRFLLDTRFDDDERIDSLLRSPDVQRDIEAPQSDEESG